MKYYNKDKIQCLECRKYYKVILWKHLKGCCNLSSKQYQEKYPNAVLISEKHREKLSETHKGYKHTEESNRKRSETLKGRKFSEESIQNMIIAQRKSFESGRVSSNKGKKLSDKHKQNMRISAIERIEDMGGIFVNYNSSACKFFDYLNKEFNLKGLHALNMGEFHIKELGYFVDYYEPNLNIVIEWDEKNHKYKKQKDIQRQTEITNFLNCKFIRINQDKSNWQNMKIEMIENLIYVKDI